MYASDTVLRSVDMPFMHRTFVCRARITPVGHRRIAEILTLTRQLYKATLEERVEARRRCRQSISWQDRFKSLTTLRRDPLYADLRNLALRIQRAPLQRVDRAFRGFFRRCQAGGTPGFPRFRPASRWRSIELNNASPGMVRRRGPRRAEPDAVRAGNRRCARHARPAETRPQPCHRRPGLVGVRDDPEGPGCKRRPSGHRGAAARHQPAVLAMRRHRAQGARRPPAPVPAVRARLRPRPQRGHQHPAAGLARPRAGPDGSSASRGHGRNGRAPRARTKRGAGPARGMTVSMSSHGYKPLTKILRARPPKPPDTPRSAHFSTESRRSGHPITGILHSAGITIAPGEGTTC